MPINRILSLPSHTDTTQHTVLTQTEMLALIVHQDNSRGPTGLEWKISCAGARTADPWNTRPASSPFLHGTALVQHSEELICNIFRRPKGEEGIAIQFRGPSHSHCYQVNDCQVTYIKNILLLKGGQYFYTEKKYVPPFVSKNILLTKGGQYFCTEKKYVPPFVSKILFILKGW